MREKTHIYKCNDCNRKCEITLIKYGCFSRPKICPLGRSTVWWRND